MANYYTQFSFIVKLNKNDITDALKIYNSLSEEDCPAKEEILDDEDYVEFIADPDKEGLWVYCEEVGNPENAARFVQYLMQHFTVLPMGFEWANTCSKPRSDAFGGGACWITKDNIEWLSTNTWLEEHCLC
jgi:hypothetical protein